MVLRTIALKLHNPSKRKKEIIDKAMLDYSRAYQYLLDKAHGEIQDIRDNYKDNKGNYRAANIAKWIDKDISKELNRFNIEPFKDSLKLDFGMTLASYLSLNEIQQDANYPTAYLSKQECEEKYERILNQLVNGKLALSEFDKEARKVIRKNNMPKPLFFCRYDINRDYCLMYDADNDRYYAKIYLMNVKDENRKEIEGNDGKELKYIHKNGGKLTGSGRKERFLIFPLSFGKWQEQYLEKAVKNPEILKTARLIKKRDEYYLSVSIAVEESAKVQIESYLGIGRALKSPVHYTVVDKDNRVLYSEKGALQHTKEYGSGKVPLDELHRIANEIVGIACKQKSQVIVKALIDKGDRLQWVNESMEIAVPILSSSNYNQLAQILDYKLPEKGLPPPIRISPSGVFYTCPECGLNTRHNRFSKDLFICTACGKTMDIEELGSFNVASRLNCNSQQSLKIKVEQISEGIRLTNKVLGLNYCIKSPQDDMEGFTKEIERIVEDFYKNIGSNTRNSEFKKKYSLIKKIQQAEDLKQIIQIV